jgi:hypothetical protein
MCLSVCPPVPSSHNISTISSIGDYDLLKMITDFFRRETIKCLTVYTRLFRSNAVSADEYAPTQYLSVTLSALQKCLTFYLDWQWLTLASRQSQQITARISLRPSPCDDVIHFFLFQGSPSTSHRQTERLDPHLQDREHPLQCTVGIAQPTRIIPMIAVANPLILIQAILGSFVSHVARVLSARPTRMPYRSREL